MINLKNYIIESLFDIEDNIDNVDESIKDRIKQFLNDNFTNALKCKISEKPNKDGKFEVSSNGNVKVKNKNITSLTNDMFIWTNIKGDFDCGYCNSLISLKGAPNEVSGDFSCDECNSLTSLEGAPKEVGGSFFCNCCRSLISLRGAPEKVGRGFHCSFCNSLKSLEGAPEEVGEDFSCEYCNSIKSLEGAPKKVSGYFSCDFCDSITSLEGAPKEIGGDFYCRSCKVKFTEEDVKKVSNVKGIIFL